ncbi:hypothetical protein BC830DRAFT_1125945 [Chytriomyces sp. MP71]|nr:hypothetical protein BC830DRAFT_1125945 [Chytriomyces sp. MP71]
MSTTGEFSIGGVVTSFMIQLAIAFGCIVAFSVLRPSNEVVYQPRLKFANPDKKPPALEKTPQAWITPVMKEDSSKAVARLGIDAVIFLKFVKFCFALFCFLTLLGIPYCAINANFYRLTGDAANTGAEVNGTSTGSKDIDNSNITVIFNSNLNALAITQLDVNSTWYWLPTILTWIFTFAVYIMIYKLYYIYGLYRQEYFRSADFQTSFHQKTLLLTDVPDHLRNDTALARYMSSQQGVAAPSQVLINRSVPGLAKLVEEHEKTTRKLEAILTKYLSDPMNLPARPASGGVDTIAALGSKLNDLEEQIYRIRAQPDSSHPVNSAGFASYNTVVQSHTACQALGLSARSFTKTEAMLKPVTVKLSPSFHEIIWENIGIAPAERLTRRYIALGLTVGISVGWVIVAGLITSLSNLNSAFSSNANVLAWIKANPTGTAFIQSFLVPVLLAVLNYLLPIALRITTRLQGAKSTSGLDRSVLYKLFTFYMVQVFLYAAGSALLTAFKQPRPDGVSITDNFKFQVTGAITGLASNSSFYISLLASYYAGYGIEIIQGLPLIDNFIRRKFFKLTPRDEYELNKPPSFDFTRIYGTLMIAFTIAITFSVVSPIILPFTALFFGLAFVVMKYQLLYVYEIKQESHGSYFLKIFNIFAFSVGFFQTLTLAVVFAANRAAASGNNGDPLKQWMLIAPLPFLTIALWLACRIWLFPRATYCTSTLNEQSLNPGLERALSSKREGPNVDDDSILEDRVFNPALAKPLMKIWVRKESAHLLPQLYQPRYRNLEDYEAKHPEGPHTAQHHRRLWAKGLPSLAGKKKEIAHIKALKHAGSVKRASTLKGNNGWDVEHGAATVGGEPIPMNQYGHDSRAASAQSVGSSDALMPQNTALDLELNASSEDLLPPEEMEAIRIQEEEERGVGQTNYQTFGKGEGHGNHSVKGFVGRILPQIPHRQDHVRQEAMPQQAVVGAAYENGARGRSQQGGMDGQSPAPPRGQSLSRGQTARSNSGNPAQSPPRRARTDRQ